MKTTTNPKETTVPTTDIPVDTDALAREALAAIGAEVVAGIAHEEALRTACVVTFNATSNGVSVRTLEALSKDVIGKKVSKTSIARYAKVGEQIANDPKVVASEALSAIYAAENKAARDAKKAKAAKAASSAEGEGEPVDAEVDSTPTELSVEFVADALLDEPVDGLLAVHAHLTAAEVDDFTALLAVALGALVGAEALAPCDQPEVKKALAAIVAGVNTVIATAK